MLGSADLAPSQGSKFSWSLGATNLATQEAGGRGARTLKGAGAASAEMLHPDP